MQRRLHTDWQLQARMAFTMLLLALVYLFFANILLRSGVGLPAIALLVGGLALSQYYFSDRLVLASTRARLVRPGELPAVEDMLARLAAIANLPTPRLAVIDSAAPNAFATGRNPGHAVVAVTTGLLRQLPPAEVEAVLGHELTHVHNRDVAVMAMATFFATIAGFIVQNAFWIGMFGGGFGGGMGGGRRNRGDAFGIVFLVSALVAVVSFFLISALSRYREYAADRGSALLTGQPGTLASALVRISGADQRIPTEDLRRMQPAAALCISPVRRAAFGELLMTHPSLEHRLTHLRRIEQELAGAGARPRH